MLASKAQCNVSSVFRLHNASTTRELNVVLDGDHTNHECFQCTLASLLTGLHRE